MVKMTVHYQGHKHCELIHQQSQSKIETDAPKDNNGKGERFSPTDLIGAALGSCILTTMDILTQKEGLEVFLENAKAEVDKIMASHPRKIQSLSVKITLSSLNSQKARARLEEIARTCPVYLSLNPDVQIPMIFEYRD